MKKYLKQNKGISIVALIVIIIVSLILVGVTIVNISIDNGLLENAETSKNKTHISKSTEKIGIEYLSLKSENESKGLETKEIFELLKQKLSLETEFIGSECMIIKIAENDFVTLLEDGTINEGKGLSLNIEDGNIDLKAKGFIQNNGELIEYTGDYIISGTTTEYCVSISEKGIYNIVIRDLNIDVVEKGLCAFDTNKNRIREGCHVKITLEGKNKLHSGAGAGLQCVGGKLQSENSSSLTLEGNGYLDAKCDGGYCGAGIGGFYTTIPLGNITINSGNYNLKGRTSGSGIGGGLRQPVGKITINGGNIVSKGGYASGIGVYAGEANIECLTINGGVLELAGGEYGCGINNVKQLIINGGTINVTSPKKCGITIFEEGSATITGGNIFANGKENEISIIPTNGKESLYLATIQLKDITEKLKVTKIETSDNLKYGINDMYTLEGGKMYLYLPEGERQIRITAGGKTYTGTVTVTPENTEIFTLTQN